MLHFDVSGSLARRVSIVLLTAASCFAATACGSKRTTGDLAPSASQNAPEDAGSDAEHSSGDVTGFRITSPASGDVLQGSQAVEVELTGGQRFSGAFLSLDGEAWTPLRSLGGLSLETLDLSNGAHTLALALETEAGERFEDSIDFAVDNPAQRLESVLGVETVYAPGALVSIELVYNQPSLLVVADFAAIDGSLEPVAAVETEPGHYLVEHALAGDFRQQVAQLRIQASEAGGPSIDTRLDLQLRAAPQLPVTVSGAVLVNDDLPPFEESEDATTSIGSISGSDGLIGQTASKVVVAWEPSPEDPPQQLIVRLDGYSGYYVVPLEPGQTEAELEIAMPSLKPGDNPGKLRALLGLVGLLPKIKFSEFNLKPFAVESGGIQFILRWASGADLDLIVRGPDGAVIDFAMPKQGDGRLDLDANGSCETSEVVAESIAWPKGKEPPGDYQVSVNLFDSCGVAAVDYELVVVSCGGSKSYTGTAKSDEIDMSGEGKVIDTIHHTCTNWVSGKVEYENGAGVRVAAQSFPVRVVRSGDDAVLARGFSDATGRYSLNFGNTGTPKYRIEVEATWADPLTRQPRLSVADFTSETPYRFRSTEVDGKANPISTQNVFVSKADHSGAFNIISVMRGVSEWVLAKRGKLLPAIGARWSPGVNTPAGTSYFFSGQLFIQGVSSDPDEFDDPVIAHELMHYIVSKLSDDDSLGGSHNSGFSGPRLAWGEGIATGLGQIALGSPIYFDNRSGFKTGYDIEKGATLLPPTPADFAKGTSDGTQKGDVSEYLIAMVLWDLHDGLDPAGDPDDEFDAPERALFGSIFDVIPAGDFDRGVLFTDFVDFLDGFRCMSGLGFSTTVDPKLRKLLNGRSFNYDFLVDEDIGCSFK